MLYLVVGVAAVTWLLLWSTTPPPRLLGVYSQPGFWYWLKVVIFYIIVKVRRWSNKTGSGAEVGYGVKARDNVELMECVQPLSDHPKAIDAVYFNGANENGHYLVVATARRPKGVINGLLFIRVPGLGLLQLPKMPDTMLFGDGEQFAAEGLRITPVKPMSVWKIQYEGPMKMKDSPLSRLNVKLDIEWTSKQPYFDFDTDMSARALARSIAREPWSRQYFQQLREAHQSHYEQMGRMEGTVVVDGHPYILRLDSMRDHSYGHKREWKLMHRYGLHMFATQDGLQGNVGIICQPATCTQLEMGYISDGGQVTPISSVNLLLWQHGENGYPPSDYSFSFVAGGKEYVVEVYVVEAPEFYIGWEWETRVVERMVTYRINGRKGWGLAEWDYRHHGGRPRAYSFTDPAWTADLVKDAEEEKITVKSDDDPQCVVHYHGLVDEKTSRIILLSDRSYSKLIEYKNIREELEDEAYHDQCESIPFPSYDAKKHGYHRPCYMKFIKIKVQKEKNKQENNSESERVVQDENNSEKESKIKIENDLEYELKTPEVNHLSNEKTKDKINIENKIRFEYDNNLEYNSKHENENCSENENISRDEHHSKDNSPVNDDCHSDYESKMNGKNYEENYTIANDENVSETIDERCHTQNQSISKYENYPENQGKTQDENHSSLDETKAANCSKNKNTSYEEIHENYSGNENYKTKAGNDLENNYENNPKHNSGSESEDRHYPDGVHNSTLETFCETENKHESQTKAKNKNYSQRQGNTKLENYSVKHRYCEDHNGMRKRHRRTYISTEDK
ncbi:uncharacterized protein LOC123514740 [Portunus trituberculatus]|uniref:uncharacterized protein LOC123514740 n=1 Tax=Portunus trituberculatus TaxID=210409 RepID=UPI001E1CCA41|nr:uncharacterized protein LOC123514740 [Portunus trituberculatus]XP_045128768.1 uncharacterized protein LOC123514740 [Portunus trituberculatus]XP_045128769.1 uncharacterized protein LOC123514740 [Portunus trituberculatus]XP_045128771.1 uncharacterized protein LOC123514740 [Portunus trituberculatus]